MMTWLQSSSAQSTAQGQRCCITGLVTHCRPFSCLPTKANTIVVLACRYCQILPYAGTKCSQQGFSVFFRISESISVGVLWRWQQKLRKTNARNNGLVLNIMQPLLHLPLEQECWFVSNPWATRCSCFINVLQELARSCRILHTEVQFAYIPLHYVFHPCKPGGCTHFKSTRHSWLYRHHYILHPDISVTERYRAHCKHATPAAASFRAGQLCTLLLASAVACLNMH